MHQRIDLASGAVNGSDQLHVELIQPVKSPACVCTVPCSR